MTPEEKAREKIDAMLTASGWTVQTKDKINLSASRGVAACELTFATGEPDYTLFVDAKSIGTVEAKPEGHSLVGVEEQSTKYVSGIPSGLPAWKSPLPFCYESTGTETCFTSRLDPDPRSRHVFAFHRPETLLAWVQQEKQLAQRLREFPPLHTAHLWPAQVETVINLEQSFAAGLRRALIQKANGSGKTFTAVNFTYRLVKYAGARRVLFLVDRGNLGRQTLKEFQQFVSPVNNYKFTEEYIVQHLTSNTLDKSARVVIGTIQRVYSMLKGEQEPAPDLDDLPIEAAETLFKKPVPVEYNPAFPIEEFDFIITDECHRSIYNLWRQVLEYFDASLIGLTATPSKQTFGFFQQNLVMEYNHEKAVADGVNVGCDIYRINTAITQAGSKVDAGFFVDKRDRQTRKVRWEQLDEPLAYDAADLDRDVVAPDQIRTVLATFRDKVFTEMFPGRTDLPKTLIFAKDDTHADDIVRICREVFGKGNDFCQKITYRTGFVRIVEKKQQADGKEVEEITWKRASSLSPEEILSAFRNSYFPRIAVTVDMIATGTDIKPLEIVFFMRSVASKNFFEQMKGRGVRVVSDTEMEQVNPGIKRKTRYVIVDAVGVCERVQTESRPLEKKPTVSFDKLLDTAALGTTEVAAIESLAGRLIRLERRFDAEVEAEVVQVAKGHTLSQIAKGLLDAVDPDKIADAAAGRDGSPSQPSAASDVGNPPNAASGDAAYNSTRPPDVGRLPPAGAPVGRVPPHGVPDPNETPPRRLRRLHRVWPDRDGNISYLLTICVDGRIRVLDNEDTFQRLVAFLLDSPQRYHWFGRRFVIMPDHLHLIAHQAYEAVRLGQWIKALKAVVGGLEPRQERPVGAPGLQDEASSDGVGRVPSHGANIGPTPPCAEDVGPVPPPGAPTPDHRFTRIPRSWRWQAGFHDHKFRTRESEARKWEYVCLNPVRYHLVKRPEEWPYGGEIFYEGAGGPHLVRGTPPLLETGILIEEDGTLRGGASQGAGQGGPEAPRGGTRPTT